jgi:hypothetical protein
MNDRQWLAIVVETAIQTPTRRDVARSLAALVPGLLLGRLAGAAAGERRGRRDGQGSRRRDQRDQGVVSAEEAAPGECRATWPGRSRRARRNRRHCRFIRRQCDGDDPREFCIVYDHENAPGEPVAVCCAEDRHCCGKACCTADQECCGGNCAPKDHPTIKCCNGRRFDTAVSSEHCGTCGNACAANEFCSLGRCVCVEDCDECPAGLTWCGDRCVDTKRDPEHCGGCFNLNPNGLTCCDGNLCTYINGVCCGGTCYPEGWPSCG